MNEKNYSYSFIDGNHKPQPSMNEWIFFDSNQMMFNMFAFFLQKKKNINHSKRFNEWMKHLMMMMTRISFSFSVSFIFWNILQTFNTQSIFVWFFTEKQTEIPKIEFGCCCFCFRKLACVSQRIVQTKFSSFGRHIVLRFESENFHWNNKNLILRIKINKFHLNERKCKCFLSFI